MWQKLIIGNIIVVNTLKKEKTILRFSSLALLSLAVTRLVESLFS